MNPHAKEFVPAYLLKRRQEEGDELAEKVGQVGLDEGGESITSARDNTGGDSTNNTATNKTDNSVTSDTSTIKSNNTEPESEQHNHSNQSENILPTNHSNNNNHHHHHHNHLTNGHPETDEDRDLLKAGETYCEFNGEQFIIPGEDDEYETEQNQNHDYGRKAGYDFGNAEDNEDEDVCNAYEQFLDNLPE